MLNEADKIATPRVFSQTVFVHYNKPAAFHKRFSVRNKTESDSESVFFEVGKST